MSDLLAELDAPAWQVAPRLLGSIITRELHGCLLTGRIVETEAYDETDAASHSYNGRTPRTEIMFGPSGFLYVYFTYGMHYCMNVVCGPAGDGSAVLVRAIEPLDNFAILSENRGKKTGSNLTNGPAKLCQAYEITKDCNGHDLTKAPLKLELQKPLNPSQIIQTTRIGIRQATQTPWRFYELSNPYVSKQ